MPAYSWFGLMQVLLDFDAFCAVMPGCKGLADSRRFDEDMSTSPHSTIPVVWQFFFSPLRCLATVYHYIHSVSRSDLFVYVCVLLDWCSCLYAVLEILYV